MRRQRKTAAALGLSLLGLTLLLAACAQSLPRESGVVKGGVDTLLRLAEVTRRAGDPAAAVPLYRRAHKLSPADPRPLLALGQTFNQLGAYAQASDTWKAALAVSPKLPSQREALRGYGFTLTALHQPHLALAKFRAALALGPDAVAYNGMGIAQDMLGAADDAQASYEAALAMAPGNLTFANNLGLSLALSGRFDRAIEVLRQVAAAPDATAEHRQNLALAFGVAGMLEDAARVARVDLDEQAVQNNLAYYAVLGSITNHAHKVSAVGTLRDRLLVAGP